MRIKKNRSHLIRLSPIALLLALILPIFVFGTQSSPAYAAPACSVDYNIVNQWDSGFQTNVTITNNTATAVQGWDLTWTFASGESVTSYWNVNMSQSGTSVSASNSAGHWNGTIGANGGTVMFGFIGAGSPPTVPTDFAVNGVSCMDDTPPTDVPPTDVPPTDVPPTDVPPTDVPPTDVPPTDVPPTDVPPTDVPPTDIPPTDIPPTDVPPTQVPGSCSVDYSFIDQWETGFTANVTITNNSSTAVSGYTLTWDFTAGQQVSSGWNVTISQSGTTVSASNPASQWNGTIAANGGTSSFGFQGTHSGNNPIPTSFALNGETCGGAPEPTPVPTTEPTVGPTQEPTAVPTTGPSPTPPPPGTHVDNPYEGALQYVNPEWSAKAAAEPGGSAVANISTGVWLDRIAAIEGTANSQSNGPMGLRDHLDEALAQSGGQPIVAQFVIYNLPGRDCSALASNGELGPDELPRYKSEYIDPIAEIMSDPKYASVRIVTIIEIDSLPNLIANLNVEMCATVQANGAYVQGIQYALDKLHAIPNVYTYVDAAHHGWIGWDSNFGPTAALLAETAAGTIDGYNSVDGFITNTANYSALREDYFSVDGTVNGQLIRQSDWVDWNYYIDELSFAQDFRLDLVTRGFPSDIGMLIDTSRNGWGGSNRPTGPSSSTDLNTFVNESRIDRRIHAGNWCNQSGAGLGERPQANPEAGIDAYVWIKPPGESDGSSELIPNDDGKGFDRMCDPTYGGNERNGNSMTGALPNAPISGAWFSAQFQELLANAYPPLP